MGAAMPEDFKAKVNRILRDHEGYTGDGRGGDGDLPIGDRSTAKKPISKRDLREAFAIYGDDSAQAVSDVNTWAGEARVDADRTAINASAVVNRAYFPEVSDLLSDNNAIIGYAGSGADFTVQPGDVIEAESFHYQVVADTEPSEHLVTSGGVKLIVLPQGGGIPLEAAGVVGDGVTDNTSAIQKVLNSLPGYGGRLILPDGRVKANIHITRSNITLVGNGMSDWRISNAEHVTKGRGLMPFDKQKPALMIGQPTGPAPYVVGTVLENLSITSEDGLDDTGLYLAGGTYGLSANGLFIDGFRRYCIRIENGDTPGASATYINISNFGFSLARGEGHEPDGATIYTKFNVNGGSIHNNFTTAIYLANGWVGARESSAMKVLSDGVSLTFSDTWIECHNYAGIKLLKSHSEVTPKVYATNTTIDSPSSSDTLFEVYELGNLFIGDFLVGSVRVDGLMENGAGDKQQISGTLRDAYSQLSYPRIFGNITFPLIDGDLTDESAGISALGEEGKRRLVLSGESGVRIPTGYLEVQSYDRGGDFRPQIQLTGSGNFPTVSMFNTDGNLEVTTDPGKSIKLGNGAWNDGYLRLGNWRLWVDATGNLRIKGNTPNSDTDGVVVGTQT